MSESDFVAIVLAAGEGTRMKSALPKVLHRVAGRAMVSWSVQVALDAGASDVVVVVGHGREAVQAELRERFGTGVRTAVQAEQLGTGHAVSCGLAEIADDATGRALVLYGDCPLVPAEALIALRSAASAAEPLALITSHIDDPTGYGRIVRDANGRVVAIREHRDCTEQEREIREWNPGMYAVDVPFLRDALGRLRADNDQGQLYLTDVVAVAAAAGGVADVPWPEPDLRGINDRWQLADADREMCARILRRHGRSGVTIRGPQTIRVEADVVIGADATIEQGVVLRGRTVVGESARIDVGCVLEDVRVEAGAWLKPYTVAADSVVGAEAQTGPFSHLRPGTELGPDTRVGNFVETKKTRLGRGSKANHLAYLGDGEIGENVNVGAGTIFCNYDGYMKHVTTLEDGCFIGSDSQLVAPVRVGKNAYVGTGTTVTLDVPEDALAVGRARQTNKDGYAPRLRAQMQARKKAAEKK